jgi:hypothetical protein
MNVNLEFLAVTKNYSTCILFIPSEVTTELAITIEVHKIAVRNSLLLSSYSIQYTPSPSCSRILAEQVIKNELTIYIYSYIKNIIKYHMW